MIHPPSPARGGRGMVNAMVVFDEKGHTASVEILMPSQADMLGPTRAALADMQMSPEILGGCPVKFVTVIPVIFAGN